MVHVAKLFEKTLEVLGHMPPFNCGNTYYSMRLNFVLNQ